MAVKTFYILPDTSAGTSAHGSLQDGGNLPATQEDTSANNGSDQSPTISVKPGAFSLSNEYLIVELALTVVTASTNSLMKWNLAQRAVAAITTSDWADPIVAFRRKRKPNKKRLWKKKRSA